jgi:hypothetical protein
LGFFTICIYLGREVVASINFDETDFGMVTVIRSNGKIYGCVDYGESFKTDDRTKKEAEDMLNRFGTHYRTFSQKLTNTQLDFKIDSIIDKLKSGKGSGLSSQSKDLLDKMAPCIEVELKEARKLLGSITEKHEKKAVSQENLNESNVGTE